LVDRCTTIDEALHLVKTNNRADMKASRIDHVAIAVQDLPAAIARLTEQFGLELVGEATNASSTVRMAYLRAGDTMLQLVMPVGPGPIREFLNANGDGLHHVCFEVDSVEAAALKPVDAVDPPELGGRGARVCFLKEPMCGTVFELTEPGQNYDGIGG
jgi:methylmalonyl-CoA/ethylmalonyl-CoA epimerase